jgi:hypothetical protein
MHFVEDRSEIQTELCSSGVGGQCPVKLFLPFWTQHWLLFTAVSSIIHVSSSLLNCMAVTANRRHSPSFHVATPQVTRFISEHFPEISNTQADKEGKVHPQLQHTYF